MSSSSKSLQKSLAVLGKVSLSQVKSANGSTGKQWQSALNIASQTVMSDFPNVNGIQIAGARAHQSHQVESHSNVISAKFFDGEQRVISGHIHENGSIDYSQKPHTGGNSGGWEPTRDQVDMAKWTVYDPERRKNRKVMADGDWWYIEKGGTKIWF